MTTNHTANHIADKNIVKHMSIHAANAIWRDLRNDGWRAEGLTRVKLIDTTYHHFVFEKHGSKAYVYHYEDAEVAS
jgi:hypothetical protein